MPYFKSPSGDFVNDQGQVVTDPAIRLQIGQSIGGDLNKLPLYNPQTHPAAPVAPVVPNPAPVGSQQANSQQPTGLLTKPGSAPSSQSLSTGSLHVVGSQKPGDAFYMGNGTINPATGQMEYPTQQPTQTTPNSGQTGQPTTTPPAPIAGPPIPGQPAGSQGQAPQNPSTNNPTQPPTTTQFYLPPIPTPGYAPQTIFDQNGKALDYKSYIAAGGKPDFSNVIKGPIPTQNASQTPQSGQNPASAGAGGLNDGSNNGLNADGTLTSTETPLSPDNNPVKTYTDAYNKILKDLGLPTLKITMDETAKKYSDLQELKIQDIANVNDNPWLSETDRARGVNAVNNKYLAKEQLLTSMLTLYNNQYSQGLSSAGVIMGDVAHDIQTAQANTQKALEANQKLVLDYGVDTPFYTIDGHTIINSQTGKAYPTYESWVKDGGGQGAKVKMIGGLMTLKEQKQFEIDLAKANNTNNGLTAGQIQSTINSIAGQFDNEAVVKNYNIISEANQFVKGLSNNTNNPADDQGLIYAFAKAMDPNSVVREGEYATVQKYAQSWADSFGFDAKRIYSNSPFLTPQARENMKATIGSKFTASEANYKNVYSEYQRRINDAKSGSISGSITNYGGAFDTSSSSGTYKDLGNFKIQDEAGNVYDFKGDQKAYDKFKTDLQKDGGVIKTSFNSAGNAKASKVVAGYDLSTYATDPNHVTGIKTIMGKIGDVASYVNKFNSPVTASMINSSAKKYGVPPTLLTALLVQESSLGTKGRAVGTKNPGNVGNTDSGAKKYYSNWQEGVDAAAYQLARRKITQTA